MIFVGIAVVLATIYLLVKQYETRMVLFTAGVVMALWEAILWPLLTLSPKA